ncbi:tRNA pseudouridine(38-40) synthase TruA [Lacunisphaera limnophila]|uniref:tRNA pseudouridine(38-40) synthase TruA n=1 Tax=Lacunisphaera limnophila TaxID=1838286 RepID=UPI0009F214D4|nr:tRNA pseudouridine(38-40) synthase TruA [Lacunisphaera limnophila]
MAPKIKPTRWKCVVAYDGTTFHGWQSQEGGNTVQDLIERQINTIFGRPIRIEGSGRTDSGVHAHAQVFHFDAPWAHGAEKLRKALQTGLPRSICLKQLRRARPDFHARFDAKGKVYRYHLNLGQADPFEVNYSWSLNRDLDWPAVLAAAKVLRGQHDFWAFSGENDRTYETTVRDLRRLEVKRRGPRVTFTFEADGFLYKMVRSLTGALVNVGLGKLTAAEIAALLKSRRRIATVVTAPPQGLFMVKVIY